MKRLILTGIIAIVIGLIFTACEGGATGSGSSSTSTQDATVTQEEKKLPHDMDQRTYDLGMSAIGIGEDYLAGNISGAEAHAQLRAIHDELDAYHAHADNSAYNAIVSSNVLNMAFCVDPIAPLNRPDKGFADFLAELEECLEYNA